ncbi:hypothetical protein CHLNCDRAFT_28955, partial [Chlorella variabilis]
QPGRCQPVPAMQQLQPPVPCRLGCCGATAAKQGCRQLLQWLHCCQGCCTPGSKAPWLLPPVQRGSCSTGP